jgi:hypothetical protein
LKNGTPIAGATKLAYTTPALTLGDNGAGFSVRVSNNMGTNFSDTATVTVDPPSPPVFTQGFLTVQRYENIPSVSLTALYADPSYPGSPTTIYWVAGADVPQTSPNLDTFGAIAWGWLAPQVTSDYTFFIRSDDHSAFYINTNAALPGVTNTVPIPNSGTPGADVPVCEEGGCCADFLEPDPNLPDWHTGEIAGLGQTTLAPIHLDAGRLYGICIAYKEGSGGDYAQVAWRAAGDTNAAASLQPIAMPNVWTMASHAGNRVSITQQPQNTTGLLSGTATFSVDASTLPTAGQWSAQWLKNGVAIIGGTGASYTTPPLQVSDNGSSYSAQVIALAGPTNSISAMLTVVGPPLTITNTGTSVTIGWGGATGTLQVAVALQGTNTVWTTVGTQNPVTLPVAPGQNRYYRVKQ